MSTSLVKLSLSLFADDILESDEPKKKKKMKDPMSMISSKKVGVKKELRKLEKKKRGTKKAGMNQKYSKHDDNNQTDYTEASVAALCRISQLDSTDQSVAKSVFAYHHKGKLKQQELKEKPAKEEESTLFTDKDFEDFSNDYDFTKHKKKK